MSLAYPFFRFASGTAVCFFRAAGCASRLIAALLLASMASMASAQVAPERILKASMSFTPSAVLSGGATQLRIVLTSTAPVSLLQFDDALPAGITAVQSTTTQCGGTLQVSATSLSFSGGALPVPGSCTIVANTFGKSDSDTTIVNTTGPIEFNDGLEIAGVSAKLEVARGVPPRIINGAPPNGLVGAAYGYLLSVVGTQIINFTVTGLPPGLAFHALTQMISGTPTVPGSYSGTITAHNAFPPDDSRDFTIVIAAPPLVIITPSLPPVAGGGDVHAPVVAAGGLPPYTFDLLSGQLPPGLSFDPQGVLVGVATLPGHYTFTVRVTDSVGTTANRTYAVDIDKSRPQFTFDIAPNPAVTGQPVIATARLSGAGAAALGNVQVWVAHSDERCPTVAGGAPVAAKTITSALGAASEVAFAFTDLGIDHYEVCASYSGDARYLGASAGPLDVFVIKGALLASATVAITAPAEVKTSEMVTASIAVRAPGQSAIAPSGSVMLRADGIVVGTAALANGVATFSTPAPGSPGQVTLSASYLGDGAFPPAVSAPANVAVTRADAIDPAAVPTLSALALMLLASLLAGVGVLLGRRQRD